MKRLLRWVHLNFKVCAGCGSWGVNRSLFCDFCESKFVLRCLWPQAEPLLAIETKKIPLRYLISWQGHQKYITRLIRQLKGGVFVEEAFDFYAELLLKKIEINQVIYSGHEIVIVPAPPSHVSDTDHALEFALALGRKTGWPVHPCLYKNSEKDQKKKSRKERQKLKLSSLEKFTKQKVVFIDDVITSGSTVKAAFRALGEPLDFEAWSLARRPLSLLRLE